MTQGFFITATDTDVGKTWITAGLLHAFKQQQHTTVVMKPISCGCEHTDDGLRNDDAVFLMEHTTESVAYDMVNPYAFEPPIAPHLAAQQAGGKIDLNMIMSTAKQLANKADVLLIEGVGGLMVPLSDTETTIDLMEALYQPLILVVGVRLGCLNHALLSVTTIKHFGLKLAGWVANKIDPESLCADENIKTLQKIIAAPLVGVVPYLENFDAQIIAEHLDISTLNDSGV